MISNLKTFNTTTATNTNNTVINRKCRRFYKHQRTPSTHLVETTITTTTTTTEEGDEEVVVLLPPPSSSSVLSAQPVSLPPPTLLKGKELSNTNYYYKMMLSSITSSLERPEDEENVVDLEEPLLFLPSAAPSTTTTATATTATATTTTTSVISEQEDLQTELLTPGDWDDIPPSITTTSTNNNSKCPTTTTTTTTTITPLLTTNAALTSSSSCHGHQQRSWNYWIIVFLTLIWNAVRLLVFVGLLAPAFARFFWYYAVTSDRIVVRYKQPSPYNTAANHNTNNNYSCRHVMDIYGATTNDNDNNDNNNQKKRVLIFLTGGAWMIGYKMWGTFLARVFCAMGVLVVVPDYPNYPQSNVPTMVQDARDAITFVLQHIHKYGGDPKRVVLAGQSAGGHLAECILLQKALVLQQKQGGVVEDNDDEESSPFNYDNNYQHYHCQQQEQQDGFHPTQLAGFCAISSPSDVQAMTTNFQKHGLDQQFVQSLFGVGERCSGDAVHGDSSIPINMEDYNPQRLVERLQKQITEQQQKLLQPLYQANKKLLPPVSIFHGTNDKTVPHQVSERFAASLVNIGFEAEYVAYEGWSHTDPILEAVMMADHRFHRDLYHKLCQWTTTTTTTTTIATDNNHNIYDYQQEWNDNLPECQPLCPTWMVQMARFCNPF